MAEEFKHIIRVANTDLDGNKPIYMALQKIRGIGFIFSSAVLNIAKIDRSTKAGTLSDKQVQALEDVILNPSKLPKWMLNRRKDYETGENLHLVMGDLKFTQSNDRRRLQKVKSYRGLRLAAGLPVRGQRTKSNFRRNKGKVQGVKKKKGK